MQGVKYNVYSQPIDPSNNMPANPNQFPHAEQKQALETGRVKSSIPKGGGTEAGETWTYPSEQMFFNALKRKGKGEDAQEEDMPTIIAIHNNMNERTWNKVMEFEKTFHCEECPDPKLLKFLGRPDDLSMKARVKTWLGWPMPFDRHDWTVDRCGTEVRYIIDYYHDDDQDGDVKPHLRSQTDMKSITVDVRPAPFDSVSNLADVVKMPLYSAAGRVADVYEDNTGVSEDNTMDGSDDYDSGMVRPALSHEEVFSTMKQFRERCTVTAKRLNDCTDEEDCARAMMALDTCFGQIVCPAQANFFSSNPCEETYESLTECIAAYRKNATALS